MQFHVSVTIGNTCLQNVLTIIHISATYATAVDAQTCIILMQESINSFTLSHTMYGSSATFWPTYSFLLPCRHFQEKHSRHILNPIELCRGDFSVLVFSSCLAVAALPTFVERKNIYEITMHYMLCFAAVLVQKVAINIR